MSGAVGVAGTPVVGDAEHPELKNWQSTEYMPLKKPGARSPGGQPAIHGLVEQQPIKGGLESAQVYHALPGLQSKSENLP